MRGGHWGCNLSDGGRVVSLRGSRSHILPDSVAHGMDFGLYSE